MTGEHEHTSAVSASGRHTRPLLIALLLTAAFMIVEVVVGLAIGSLALISDAGHMLTDVVGLAMALAAIQVAQTRRSPSATFGLYRLEVLAALANTLLLFGVAAYVLYEAWQRFGDPSDVSGVWMLGIAIVGLCINIISFMLLRRGASESINVRGASLEVVSDLLGSLGVIVAAIVLITTGWSYIDPIVGVAIGLFILPRAYRLGREALRVLLQVAPAEIDVEGLEASLASLPGVSQVHDLHVWTLTSGLRVASGHLEIAAGSDATQLLTDATAVVSGAGIEHVTLQIDPHGSAHSKAMVI